MGWSFGFVVVLLCEPLFSSAHSAALIPHRDAQGVALRHCCCPSFWFGLDVGETVHSQSSRDEYYAVEPPFCGLTSQVVVDAGVTSLCGCNAVACCCIVLRALAVALVLFSGRGSGSDSAAVVIVSCCVKYASCFSLHHSSL